MALAAAGPFWLAPVGALIAALAVLVGLERGAYAGDDRLVSAGFSR